MNWFDWLTIGAAVLGLIAILGWEAVKVLQGVASRGHQFRGSQRTDKERAG